METQSKNLRMLKRILKLLGVFIGFSIFFFIIFVFSVLAATNDTLWGGFWLGLFGVFGSLLITSLIFTKYVRDKQIFSSMLLAWFFVLVLFAILYYLSATSFYPSSGVADSCTQQAGFLCTGLSYSHTGALTVTVAQMSGTAWTNWVLGFQPGPIGTTVGNIFPAISTNTNLPPGVQITNTIVIGANTIGYPLQGVLWACWSGTSESLGMNCSTGNLAMVGIVNTKAQ